MISSAGWGEACLSGALRRVLVTVAAALGSLVLTLTASAECNGCKSAKILLLGNDPCWILDVDVTAYDGQCVWNGDECAQDTRCSIYIQWKVISSGAPGCPTSGSFDFGYEWDEGHTLGTVVNGTMQQTFQRIGCGAGPLLLAVSNGPNAVGGAAGTCSACGGSG